MNYKETQAYDTLRAMESLKKINAGKVHLTLTLAEVDALLLAGRFALQHGMSLSHNLESALQLFDEVINL